MFGSALADAAFVDDDDDAEFFAEEGDDDDDEFEAFGGGGGDDDDVELAMNRCGAKRHLSEVADDAVATLRKARH
jgi:hypothetical protein